MTLGTLSYASPQGPPSLEHNRRTGLIVFGIISILLGAASAVIALGVANILFLKAFNPIVSGPQADIPELILGLGTYVFFAVGFVMLGIGSMRCRRWVRPIVLAFGAVIIVGSLLKFTAIADAVLEKSYLPSSRIPNLDFAAVVFGLLIGLALIYIGFYAKDTVRQTLAAYDVNSSWCDELPLPVLTAAVGLFVAGMGVALLSTDTRPPFGGARLGGAPSVTIKLLYGIIILASAALVYQMKVQGCWLAAVTLFGGFTANLISRFTEGAGEMTAISQGPMGPASATPQLPTPNLTVILAGVVCVRYLLWVLRYFRRPRVVVQ